MFDELEKKILAELLRSRLSEVEKIIGCHGPPVNYTKDLKLEVDAEEILRKLMVVILPKIKNEYPDLQKVKIFFNLIHQLKTKAISNDYRFLDVWNNSFEVMNAWHNLENEDGIFQFMNEYKKILEYHIKKLESN